MLRPESLRDELRRQRAVVIERRSATPRPLVKVELDLRSTLLVLAQQCCRLEREGPQRVMKLSIPHPSPIPQAGAEPFKPA